MKIQQIIVPTDLSEASYRAFPLAITQAKLGKVPIELLHVFEEVPLLAFAPMDGLYADPNAYEAAASGKAEKLLGDLCHSLSKKNPTLEFSYKVLSGSPARVITDHAASSPSSMIVMSTEGRTGLSSILIGSVAERVVQLSSSPVLTTGPSVTERKPPLKVLCAIDQSQTSLSILKDADNFAQQLQANLDFVHVLDDRSTAYGLNLALFPDVAGTQMMALSEVEVRKHLEAAIQEHLGSPPKGSLEIIPGVPHEMIAKLSVQYDLLVIGTHGRTGLDHFVMGSVAERIVRLAKCPTLTVRNH